MITILETHTDIRPFHVEIPDGTGTRDETTAATIQSEAALRQLGVIGINFASASERVEFRYVRVRHAETCDYLGAGAGGRIHAELQPDESHLELHDAVHGLEIRFVEFEDGPVPLQRAR